ncbi:hypothetical protein [Georgenia ruanii]|uniref:hypothetical protein n=1 Tax=Georgenia ruanii TaxID=348442 RepID=UPI00126522BF|nr:hypothetical protein [Georgenia ruanii]
MTDRHADPDALLDLALGHACEPRRGALLRHLTTCEACRRDYAELVAGVDRVLVAAPAADPPPGFDRAVLAAMGMSERTATAPGARPTSAAGARPTTAPGARPTTAAVARPATAPAARPRRPRRRALVLAASVAAAAGAALGAVVTATVVGDQPAAQVAAGTPMVTAGGDRVGSVATSYYDGGPVLVLDVAGRPGATYECRLVHEDGTSETMGRWTLGQDAATWVVPAPARAGGELQLVTPAGQVWATARL